MRRWLLAIPLLLVAIGLHLATRTTSGSPADGALNPGGDRTQAPEAQAPLPQAQVLAAQRENNGPPSPEQLAARSGDLIGSCIDHWSAAPVPDLTLKLRAAGETLATCTSDESGAFQASLGAEAFESIELASGSPWWLVAQEYVDGQHLLRLAPHDVGPFRARLVDAATGERIPEYVIRLEDSKGWGETLQSDGEGLIESSLLLARGSLKFHASSEETSNQFRNPVLATHEHTPRGASPPLVSLAIEIGPTYRVHLENPGGVPLANLRAYLAPPMWMEEVIGDSAEAFTVHPGKPNWVRFPRDAQWGEDSHLIIADTGGRWCGHSPVDLGPGRHEDPVHLRLERRLRFRGRVQDSDDEPVARTVIELIPVSADGLGPSRMANSNGLGNFLFENLAPGDYELFARHRQAGMRRMRVKVTDDSKDPLLVRLEPVPFAGDVAGTVRSLSGSYRDPLTVLLSPLGDIADEVPTRQIRVPWNEVGGSWEAPFRFEGVPHGKYELISLVMKGDYAIEPATTKLSPPAEQVDLVVRDDHPRFRIGFTVIDGDSGRWLKGAQLRLIDQAGMVIFEGNVTDWRPTRRFADGEEFDWKVHCPGFVSQRGKRAEFDARTSINPHYAIIQLIKD